MNRAKQLPLAIAALLIVAILAGCVPPAPVQSVPQQDLPIAGLGVNTSVFKDVVIEQDLDVNNALSVDGATTLVGATTITGALTQTGAIDANGGIAIDDWVGLTAQTAISVTAGAIITPTGTYQPIESAGAVTTSTTTPIAAGTTVGDILILHNLNASDAITIDGTGGNVECKADVALGAGDTLTLLWTGSDWNCLSSYDNS